MSESIVRMMQDRPGGGSSLLPPEPRFVACREPDPNSELCCAKGRGHTGAHSCYDHVIGEAVEWRAGYFEDDEGGQQD